MKQADKTGETVVFPHTNVHGELCKPIRHFANLHTLCKCCHEGVFHDYYTPELYRITEFNKLSSLL